MLFFDGLVILNYLLCIWNIIWKEYITTEPENVEIESNIKMPFHLRVTWSYYGGVKVLPS